MSCPTCSQPGPDGTENEFRPFCSSRCKAIDLGKWLNEEYIIHEPILDPDLEERLSAHKAISEVSGRDPKAHLH